MRRHVKTARYLTVIGVLALYVVGLVLNTGLGSLSAFGIGDVSLICPLGALETSLAGRVILPLPLIAIAVTALVAIFAGRVFCGWVCPVPLVRKLVTNKEERDAFGKERKQAGKAKNGYGDKPNTSEGEDSLAKADRWPGLGKGSTSALGVLAVTLVTTLVFGFPVFCLVCPVGLVFATLFAVVRLVVFNELVVDLLLFPALIVLELVVLRKWCATLCPIGALLGLFARFNKTFVPTVDHQACLINTQGSDCHACHAACNSDIDLVRAVGSGRLHDCTRCRECSAHCPADAISFPWKAKRG